MGILLLGALLYRRIYIVKDRCGKKEVPLSFMNVRHYPLSLIRILGPHVSGGGTTNFECTFSNLWITSEHAPESDRVTFGDFRGRRS